MIKEPDDSALLDLLDRLQIFSKARLGEDNEEEALPVITGESKNKINTLIVNVTANATEGIFRVSSKTSDLQAFLNNLEAAKLEVVKIGEDVLLVANALKALWRESVIIPPRFYFPLLRILHVKSTIKRVELMQKILSCFDADRRILLHQVILVAKGLVEEGECKLDLHGMAVLLAPCVFSKRPEILLNAFPLEIDEPDVSPFGEDVGTDRDALALKEVEWMIELFVFLAKHEQRIFKAI